MPTVWDETRFLGGYPGRAFAVARRHGENWYVAATNGENEPQTLTLAAPFLAGQTFTLIHDETSGPAAATRSITVPTDGTLRLTLAANGGAVLY